MRTFIHYKMGKEILSSLEKNNININRKMFLFGNLFPDLTHSYLWRKHKYEESKEYLFKKIRKIAKGTRFYSFYLGIITHYLCDYFCYPHSSSFNNNLIEHIKYELKQKWPPKIFTDLKLEIKSIVDLDRYVKKYDEYRLMVCNQHFGDDLQLAFLVSFSILWEIIL